MQDSEFENCWTISWTGWEGMGLAHREGWDASFADCESILTEKAQGMGTDAATWLDVVVGT